MLPPIRTLSDHEIQHEQMGLARLNDGIIVPLPDLNSRPAAGIFGKGVCQITTPTYKIFCESNSVSWTSRGSGPIADRPSASLFGVGTWQDGINLYNSDGNTWIHLGLTTASPAIQDIAVWGDSLTAGAFITVPYPSAMAESIGATAYIGARPVDGSVIYNGGNSGETSTQIRTRFIAATDKYSWPTIIWAGRNNFNSPDTVKADIAAMVSALTTENYVVMGIINGTNELAGSAELNTIKQLNVDLASIYSTHFTDIREYLVSQYNPSIPQDVIDFNNDVPPTSLRYDGLHLNNAGYKILSDKLLSDFNYVLIQNSGASYQNSVIGAGLPTDATTAFSVLNKYHSPIFNVLNNGNTEVSGDFVNAGIKWRSKDVAAHNIWVSVAYGKGLFVAIASSGTGNRVMTSPDGEIWTVRISAADNAWTKVVYGDGLFVAVAGSGTGNRVMTSPDGITWTLRVSAADNYWRSLTYGKGLFVAVGSTGTGNRVMTSPNGLDWILRTSAIDNLWMDITYGNGLFVAISYSGTGNRIMTSPDGITWTGRTAASVAGWRSVTYANGIFVAVGDAGAVSSSPDGITWTLRISPNGTSNWYTVTYGSGLFVAVAGSGTGGWVMSSYDGITWELRDNGYQRNQNWSSIVYGNGVFVAAPQSTTLDTIMISGKLLYQREPNTSINKGGIEIDGNIIVDKTITAPGTTGSQIINKPSGSVNFAASAASLVVNNNIVNADSIIDCIIGSNDTTMKSAIAVAGEGSFTIYPDVAPTAETKVGFVVYN